MTKTEKNDKKKDIKTLYKKLDKKTEFIEKAGQHFDLDPLYLRNHWFTAFWSVPPAKQDDLIALLNETLAQQKKEV